jgi:hypothetical protein
MVTGDRHIAERQIAIGVTVDRTATGGIAAGQRQPGDDRRYVASDIKSPPIGAGTGTKCK